MVCELSPSSEDAVSAHALIRIDTSEKRAHACVNAVTTMSSLVVSPQTATVVATPRGVTSVMASQIQAFNESFTVKWVSLLSIIKKNIYLLFIRLCQILKYITND